MRLVLPSTLIRWASSSKTHRFSNALESGSKQKLIHIVLFWTGKGRNRIKMKTMTENIPVQFLAQFYGFRTFKCGQSKTHTFENALVWTGLDVTIVLIINIDLSGICFKGETR